jgi:hypothetical protein
MSWPKPAPGLVIRYSYLWRREHSAGQEEGLKDRPCAIIFALLDEDGELRVTVLPVTHVAPREQHMAVELPMATKRRLGLDDERSWIVLTEGNEFAWPGPDLRPIAGGGAESVALGFLPPKLFSLVRDQFLALHRRRKAAVVTRS